MQYDFRKVLQFVAAGDDHVFFLPANPTRISFTVSSYPQSAALYISNKPGNDTADIWLTCDSRSGTIVTYRDVGPLIWEPIYAFHGGAAGVDMVIAEVFKLRSC